MRPSKKLEIAFETIIWNFRFFVLLPVIFSLLSAVKFFIIGTLDIWAGFSLRFDITDPEGEVTNRIVSYIIGGVDHYLIGIVLLIFALGIYELFISEIDVKFEHEVNILQSESLEELKSKLVQVIVVALIVSLFKRMLGLELNQASDLAYGALAILLISVSSYLLQLQYTKMHEVTNNNRSQINKEEPFNQSKRTQ
ncbi:YqhA family protein [cf. Phormidesmis sp. LEGE 11477]|uniref:YqhA family protein n=1 Tax=cf. Phormidesmis sp. LEGE 11477 TaxID=1828680 RepID=UPI001882280E|nr:YqhA family protein [cf. Phormidesmis sp. LEGE 11477]MBE9061601.1 YqhA family protein [cf. Phormidesmis sp. LEGE 11477]